VTEPGALEFRWIASDDALRDVIDALIDQPQYALDTEFHRERTFFPALALVQIAWPGDLVLIDPLAVDITALADLFNTETEAVLHAAQQDLDVLSHAVGAVPKRLFDTQIAAGFAGYGTPSLGALLQGEVGISPAKGDRLTDWLRRPLTADQLQYAANDVAHLLEVRERLGERLREQNRLDWVTEAVEDLLARPISGSAPDMAWLRIKDVRSLRPRARAVAQSLASWRERRAIEVDQPVRHVLADLAVIGIAQRQPERVEDLASCRGVDGRSIRGRIGDEIIDAVQRGLSAEPPEIPPSSDDLDRDLRPVVALVAAWVAQVARDERIDPTLLATRADIVAALSGEGSSRLRRGWRNELLGAGIEELVSGRAGLTFVSGQGLRLVSVA
jgi:ribonuclease D